MKKSSKTSLLSAAAAALLLATCASPNRPAAAPDKAGLPVAGTASRVVFISFDGLGADDLTSRPELQTLAGMKSAGLVVQRVVPVTPSATAVAHASMITGATPNVTGIVANRFHKANTPWNESTTGFTADLDAETIVEAAHRSGKRVGSIAFPSIDFRNARRSADWGISFVQPLTRPRIIHLKRADFHGQWVPPGWTQSAPRHDSYSPAMRARIEWTVPEKTRQDVDVVAYDTTDDHVRNYDAFYVETKSGESRPDAAGWFAVSAPLADGLYGSWSKITRTDPALNDVTIYWGAVMHNAVYPESFRRMVDDEIGFWPGQPDEQFAALGQAGGDGIDAKTFAEQNERLTRFLADATSLGIRRMPFDLLLSYQPGIDSAEHQFLIVNERQANATAAAMAAGQSVRSRAFADADRVIAAAGSALDPAKDALVVTGDHGIGPAESEVRLGSLLARWNVQKDWLIFASGNVAHFYRTGSADSTAQLTQNLKATGWFERIDTRTASTHPNSGDIVAYSYPPIGLNPGGGAGDIVTKPAYYGQHGGVGTHPEFHTVLVAWGAGVPSATIPQARQTQIARFVSRLLGIDPPKNAE